MKNGHDHDFRSPDQATVFQRTVTCSADQGRRLDQFLSQPFFGLSRSRAQKLLINEMVQVNGLPCNDKNYRVQEGDLVTVTIPFPEETRLEPEAIPLDIFYEDKDLLVVNKPRGMVVHPAPGHRKGTLVNALLHHCAELSIIGGVKRPGIVHRLDKDTSGLLLVAKNDFAHRALSTQLKTRQLKREYLALVKGAVKPVQGRIEAPVARHPRHRKKMAVVETGKMAVTRYRVLKYYGSYSLLKINLETGRTHQIRVHMAYLGHPVAGDLTYARDSWSDLPRGLAEPQALHARRIKFIHPRSEKTLEFSAPLPEAFKKGLIELNARKL